MVISGSRWERSFLNWGSGRFFLDDVLRFRVKGQLWRAERRIVWTTIVICAIGETISGHAGFLFFEAGKGFGSLFLDFFLALSLGASLANLSRYEANKDEERPPEHDDRSTTKEEDGEEERKEIKSAFESVRDAAKENAASESRISDEDSVLRIPNLLEDRIEVIKRPCACGNEAHEESKADPEKEGAKVEIPA